MKLKAKIQKYVSVLLVMVAGALFVVKFGMPAILKAYIKNGIGNCDKIPVFCMAPAGPVIDTELDRVYLQQLIPYKFPILEVSFPKGFNVVQEELKKVYYKRKRPKGALPTAYITYRPAGFFMGLFPNLKKVGINDDYEFLRRTMYAHVEQIKSLTDAFFVIMKGVFVPDLGNQHTAVMRQFSMLGKRGFINYNLAKPDNYFDCNVFDENGDFFKMYIKDKGAKLSLEQVLMIISTLKHAP